MSNAPTDPELKKLAEECEIGWAAGLGGMDDFLRVFASGVLAKWGAQQEAQEPVVAAVFDEQLGRPMLVEGAPLLIHGQELYIAPRPATAPLSDDVVKDAARYAALRDGSIEHDDILETIKEPGKWNEPYAVLLRGVALDSAIDAALAAQKGTK